MKLRSLALGAATTLTLLLSACGGVADTPTPGTGATGSATNTTTGGAATPAAGGAAVVVSSKNFTEEVILGEMYAMALEAAQIPVTRKLNLGTTDIAQAALVKGGANGGIDLYPEYTGTGLLTVLKQASIADPQQAYDAVKKGYESQFKLTWLDKTPMNDTQAMATTKEVSDSIGIKTLQDLCDKADQITVAAVAEFSTREDALPALQKLYGGCKFKDVKIFEPNLRYQALVNKDVNVAQAFSTDGPISGNNLVVLQDPKNWGPPDNVAPVVRDDVLAKYPNMASVLNAVSAKITNEAMTGLNWQVDGQGKDAHDVAKEWMMQNGLISK